MVDPELFLSLQVKQMPPFIFKNVQPPAYQNFEKSDPQETAIPFIHALK